MPEYNVDVLIVGAGPIGLFCANEVIRQGLSCRIIDKKNKLATESRTLSLHSRTLDVFEDSGFLHKLREKAHTLKTIALHAQGQMLAQLDSSELQNKQDFLIQLPQNQIEAILLNALHTKNHDVECNTELTHITQAPEEITATIKKPNNKIELFHANWLIACDGAESAVRQLLDAQYTQTTTQQTWWLADLDIHWDHSPQELTFYGSKKGPMACFPSGGKRHQLIMTAPSNTQDEPTLESIAQEFKLRSKQAALLSEPATFSRKTVHGHQIQQYRHDRVFFAGDSAHAHSPLLGQGINTGFQDVSNLIWKLALVEKGQAQPELLDSYHLERFPASTKALQHTHAMTLSLLLNTPLKHLLLKLKTALPPLKKARLDELAQHHIAYIQSPIIYSSKAMKRYKAGHYLPDFELINASSGQIEHKNSIIHGTHHHLFIFSGLKINEIDELVKPIHALKQQLGPVAKLHVILGHEPKIQDKSVTLWIDKDYHLHQRLGIKKPTLILIRPDKYIGASLKPKHIPKWIQQLYFTTPEIPSSVE